MIFLPDTNACISLLRRRTPSLMARWQSTRAADIVLCSVVVYELRHGAERSSKRKVADKVESQHWEAVMKNRKIAGLTPTLIHAPFFCHPSAGKWRQHGLCTSPAWPPAHNHHGDLYKSLHKTFAQVIRPAPPPLWVRT
ncbi:MAG: hypothetical protein DMF74_23040 [Acidobacteria bacterium]|nr:MAG: hypothetical protein DMF74_23040 [Acidobacteriota bacterium]